MENSSVKLKRDLPVAVDAMGGDYGSGVVVEGAIAAAEEFKIKSIIVGFEEEIKERLQKLNALNNPYVSVVNAPEFIDMNDSPSVAIKGKSKSSIRIAFQLVKEGKASSVVSPGNTGAVMAAGVYVSGTLPGIVRPAIATLIPKTIGTKPTVLLDSGANVDCQAYQLVQFALMGYYYAKVALGSDITDKESKEGYSPRVALLSNGSELSKGTDIIRSAAFTLSEMKDINFIGYVEGRDIPKDIADVVVCDGFVGNVILKSMEGTVELVVDSLKKYAEEGTLRSKIGMWLAKPVFKTLFKEKFDPSAYGGAPLLGLNDIVIICHGSSNNRAIKNAIRIAHQYSNQDLVVKIGHILSSLVLGDQGGMFEDDILIRMKQRIEKRIERRGNTQQNSAEDIEGSAIKQKNSDEQVADIDEDN
jgi:phosphate acyltransferase